MDSEQLTPIIDNIAKVLEGKVSRSEIEAEVVRFVEVYQVDDPEKLMKSVITKHTKNAESGRSLDFVTGNRIQKKISDLTGSETDFDILAKVLFAEKKNVTIRGAPRNIVSGTLGDETGTAQFTIWDGENCSLDQGAVYLFKSAYAKSWNDRVQINLGSKGRISPENVTIDVPDIQNTPSQSSAPGSMMKIADLKGSENNVDIEAKAVIAEKRSVMVKGESRIIISGTLGDETGTAQFTIWNAEEIDMEPGSSYVCRNAYTKLWNDQVQINLGNRGTVEKLDREIVATSAPPITKASAPQTPGVRMKISELRGSESNVDILAKVVFSEKRTVSIKGENREIISGILGDETGTASFTAWDSAIGDMDKGSVYLISSAYTKLWNEKVQINLGSRCTIAQQDVVITTPDRPAPSSSASVKIGDLREGMGSVNVSGKLVFVESRIVNIKGEDKPVWSGLIADETGKVQFSAWNDFGLREDSAVRIENGYVRGWKGIPQLNIGDKSSVTEIEDTFGNLSATDANQKTIGKIIETNGGVDMIVTGTIVELRQGSGLIRRCPICKRSIITNECMNDGLVEPVIDIRMKIIVDDGTGAMGAVINREYTEKLTGLTLDNAVEIAMTSGEPSVAKELASRILFKQVKLRGNVMSDEYGPSIIVRSAEIASDDQEKRANELCDKIMEAIM